MSASSGRPLEVEPVPTPASDGGPQITYAECRRCGTQIAGLDGRYSCGVCGWVNHHSEGHRELPTPADDPDAANHRQNPVE
ncbi:hypothetical protein ACFYYH_13615 [Streptomyces sp. NPDC002018]|uniref:hypothetical protein n=1 Tax=Streptomyces sp. NPDC002018 TaxID=3364629 RepID=UPI0036BF6C77